MKIGKRNDNKAIKNKPIKPKFKIILTTSESKYSAFNPDPKMNDKGFSILI